MKRVFKNIPIPDADGEYIQEIPDGWEVVGVLKTAYGPMLVLMADELEYQRKQHRATVSYS